MANLKNWATSKYEATSLINWFKSKHRPLPWRVDQDPYKIWISEIMLQQTTVVAVVPYFEKFIAAFPTLESLASSNVQTVLSNWAGLGYYSRAHNLHKAANELIDFLRTHGRLPNTYKEWIQFPGLGNYTSRSVASLAFGEKVGVVDGNVIRVLSRRWNSAWVWWKPKIRDEIQHLADQLALEGNPYHLNQGLMELGATICTKEKPLCSLCPWSQSCLAFKNNTIGNLPLKKPRKEKTLWIYEPLLYQKSHFLLLEKDLNLPVIGKMWLFPGTIKKITKAPSKFYFTHSVTDNLIYISKINRFDAKKMKNVRLKACQEWIKESDLTLFSQTSLTKKILEHSPK